MKDGSLRWKEMKKRGKLSRVAKVLVVLHAADSEEAKSKKGKSGDPPMDNILRPLIASYHMRVPGELLETTHTSCCFCFTLH